MNNQPEIESTVPKTESLKSGRGSSGRVFLFVLLLILAVLITALATFSYTINEFCHVADENSVKLQTITKLLEDRAYYDADYDEMLDAALKAYVGAAGDKYTTYYTAEEYAALSQENEGNYVGIGVTIQEATVEYLGREVDVLEIVRISPNSPAASSGMLVGDYIYAVEAEDGIKYVDDLGRDLATNFIRGEVGTSVKILWLTASQDGYTIKEAELMREKVYTVSVDFSVSKTNASVGIVTIGQFDLTTPTQLCAAFDSLEKQGISKVVLDLRDNGGGDLRSVIACASYFLESGDAIISTEDKSGAKETQWALRRVYSGTYASCSVYEEDLGKYRDFEIAVLVNGNTASAAELLTAVFRDYDLAPIVGVQTFGKGSMQTLISLEPYGMEGGLKITTNLYFPPNGEGYNGVGITPDIVIEPSEGFDISNATEEQDVQLLRAIEELIKE